MNIGDLDPQTGDSQGRLSPASTQTVTGLAHRVKYTFYSRLHTAKRMQRRALTWNAFLVISSIVTAMVSIVLLEDPTAFGPKGQVMLVIVGVGTLSASLLVTSSNYSAKAEMYFRGHRDLQTLWNDLDHSQNMSEDEAKNFEDRYQQILNELPNHSDADYQKAKIDILKSERNGSQNSSNDTNDQANEKYKPSIIAKVSLFVSSAFTYLPIGLSIAFLGLLVPMMIWFVE